MLFKHLFSFVENRGIKKAFYEQCYCETGMVITGDDSQQWHKVDKENDAG